MHSRTRSSIILGLLALALFIARWPLDDYICNPQTWHSATLTDPRDPSKPLSWREPPSKSGESIFDLVFKGGAGTPAVFAMLGGQRYVVANILWNYSDVLFHTGKIYEMVSTLGACVTLNPSNTDAWSVYGWHMAWNLYVDTKDLPGKELWLLRGEEAYRRAMEANPDKPTTYFDLAWLKMRRRGDYAAALPLLQEIVESGRFKPLTTQEIQKMATADYDVILERKWRPTVHGHNLAYVYKKLGIITGDPQYFERAIATYRLCVKLDPNDESAIKNAAELRKKMRDNAWIAEQRQKEDQVRQNNGLSPLEYGMSPSEATYGTHGHSEGDGHDHH